MGLFDDETSDQIGDIERGGRTLWGVNRAAKEPLLAALKMAPAYAARINPAISLGCAAKDVYDFATSENDRQRNEAASQLVIDGLGCIPGWGAIATGVDGAFGLGKALGVNDKYLNEYMADGVESLIGTKDDQLDERYRDPASPVA